MIFVELIKGNNFYLKTGVAIKNLTNVTNVILLLKYLSFICDKKYELSLHLVDDNYIKDGSELQLT